MSGNVAILSKLRAAGSLTCVVATGGDASHAYCWGAGPMGAEAVTAGSQYRQVANIQDIDDLALGREHACAVARAAGSTSSAPAQVWCWGTNSNKQINPRAGKDATYATPIAITFPPEPKG